MKLSKYNLFIPLENEDKMILFNTLYGSIFVIDTKVRELLRKNNFDKLEESILQEYKDKKIIIDKKTDEQLLIEHFHNKEKYSGTSLTFTILLTWVCNLKCVYCYEGAGQKKDSMTTETADKIIKYIKNKARLSSIKRINILLFGGEPLMNFDMGNYILKHVNDYCKEEQIYFSSSIITNGTLISQKIIDKLIQYNCKYIQITVDGPKEIHDGRRMYKNGKGTFDIIMDKIKLLRERDEIVNPHIRINIDNQNKELAPNFLKELKEHGFTDCGIDFGIVRAGTEACSSYSGSCMLEEEAALTLNELWLKAIDLGFSMNIRPVRKWIYCGLNGEHSISVAPNGDIYKCWEHIGDNEHLVGTIDDEGHLSVKYAYYDWMTRNPLQMDDCKECIYLPNCGGGCGSVSYEKTGSYHEKGCFNVKKVIENKLKIFLELKYPELFKSNKYIGQWK